MADVAEAKHLAAEQVHQMFLKSEKRCLEAEKNHLTYVEAEKGLFAHVKAQNQCLWADAEKKWLEFEAEPKCLKAVEAQK